MTDAFQPDPPRSVSPWKIGLAVGLGCFAIIAVIALLVGGGLFAAFKTVKESGPLPAGLELARSNPAVVESLGEPIKVGMRMSGDIHFNNDGGSADVWFPISGPKGAGSLHLVGTRQNEQWTFDVAEVVLDDSGTTIDLLGDRG